MATQLANSASASADGSRFREKREHREPRIRRQLHRFIGQLKVAHDRMVYPLDAGAALAPHGHMSFPSGAIDRGRFSRRTRTDSRIAQLVHNRMVLRSATKMTKTRPPFR